ncbi:DUF7311 family protein [Salinirubrum litoreum]|uniref:ABC transporter n=1 Tax=Salinirubrum litoreum TaxID=1126234 RepID=A0ABD5RBA9_9EURY|nr:ABC transporter [Salinirubrum litoreum]
MIRAVLAVCLAVSLLGVALPAVENASSDHSARLADAELTRLRATLTDLAATDDALPADSPGARRLVTLRIPTPDLTAAPVAYLAVGGVPDSDSRPGTGSTPDRLAYRLDGGQPRTITVPVDLRTADRDPLVFRSPGRHRLRCRLLADDAGVGVHVERVG